MKNSYLLLLFCMCSCSQVQVKKQQNYCSENSNLTELVQHDLYHEGEIFFSYTGS
jgi:hypothetical protein